MNSTAPKILASSQFRSEFRPFPDLNTVPTSCLFHFLQFQNIRVAEGSRDILTEMETASRDKIIQIL